MFQEKLQQFGDKTVHDLIANYIKLGLKAFGEFEAGTFAVATETGMEISAPFHARMMEQGRKPGKFPPPDEILRWVRLGKIQKRSNISDESLAYLIGRKISREGIKVPTKYNIGRVISSVLTDGRIEQLEDEIFEQLRLNIQRETIRAYDAF
jgi:hypothetical protein